MSKKKGKKAQYSAPEETAGADALTVAWMLAVLISLLSEIGAVAATWYYTKEPQAVSIGAMGNLLFFTAVIAGIISLILVGIVYKVRRVPPPLPVTVFAVVVGAAPLVSILTRAIMAS